MNATQPKTESPDPNYQQALSAYVERGGEALLARAYDFGREALAQVAREVPAAGPKIQECQKLLDQAEQQLRHLSHELRPMVLDDLGWLAAIEFLAAAVSARTLIPIDVRSSVTQRLPAAVETALYRVVQEALTNAARHAHATRIRKIGRAHV